MNGRKIEQRTIDFIQEMDRLKALGQLPTSQELATIIGVASKVTISEIRAHRQNIQPAQWNKFRQHFKIKGYQEKNSMSLPDQVTIILKNQQEIIKKLNQIMSVQKETKRK